MPQLRSRNPNQETGSSKLLFLFTRYLSPWPFGLYHTIIHSHIRLWVCYVVGVAKCQDSLKLVSELLRRDFLHTEDVLFNQPIDPLIRASRFSSSVFAHVLLWVCKCEGYYGVGNVWRIIYITIATNFVACYFGWYWLFLHLAKNVVSLPFFFY